MPIILACECGKKLKARDEQAGRRMRCPGCGAILAVPALEEYDDSAEERDLEPDPAQEPATLPAEEDLHTRSFEEAGDTPTATLDLSTGDDRAPPGYEILEELGRGGMGVVYKAHQRALGRTCALKMILAGQHAGKEQRRRFLDEAQALARLQHPGIVQVFEVGEHRGHPFMALEFCSGGALDSYLLEHSPTPRQAASMVQVLAQALEAAHQGNLLHRDLKPGNILLAQPAEASAGEIPPLKITDFGLAKKLDEEGNTRTGTALGTPAYMPPEQALGAKDLGPGVDVYSLGAVLYHLLTGRPPFRGTTPIETLRLVVETEAVGVRALSPATPRDLDTICRKCLRKEAKQRYGSARELAEDLDRFLAGKPIAARPVGRVERGVKWMRRNPVGAGLVGTIVLAVVSALVLAGLMVQGAREREEAEVRKAREVAEVANYIFRLRDVQSELKQGRRSEALTLLRTCDPRYIGWEHCYFLFAAWPPRGTEGNFTWQGHQGPVISVGFDPDGRRIVSGNKDGPLKVWDSWTGKLLFQNWVVGQTSGVVAFSPDGRRLVSGRAVYDAVTGEDVLWLRNSGEGAITAVTAQAIRPDGRRIVIVGSGSHVWDTETGKEVLSLSPSKRIWPFPSNTCLAYRPDGHRIVSGCSDNTVKIWDVVTGKEVRAFRGHTAPVTCVAYSPDGRRIVSGSEDKTLKVWDAATGRETLLLFGHFDRVTSVAVSPDGRRIVSGSQDGTMIVWDFSTGLLLCRLRRDAGGADDRGHGVSSVAFSSDGRRIVSGSEDGKITVWSGRGMHNWVLLSDNNIREIAFRPDGRQFAVSGARMQVWDVEAGKLVFDGSSRDSLEYSLEYSPDGRQIASISNGFVKLWDPDTGKDIRVFNMVSRNEGGINVLTHKDGFSATSVSFSPDGRRIVTGSEKGLLKVWNAANGKVVHNLKGHEHYVTCVAYSPDGRRIVSVCRDRTMKVWDAENGQEILTHKGFVNWWVVFSPDGSRFVGGANGTMKVWDAENGQEVLTLKGDVHPRVVFSPDGSRFVSVADGTMRVWDAGNGQEVLTLKGRPPVNCVAFSPDGRHIVSGSLPRVGEMDPRCTVEVWDAGNGRKLFSWSGEYCERLVISPDARRIVYEIFGRLTVLDLESMLKFRPLSVVEGTLYESLSIINSDTVYPVEFSPDGRQIVEGSEDRTFQVWDAKNGKEIPTLVRKDSRRKVAEYVSGSWGPVKVRDAVNGQEICILKELSSSIVNCLAFSPDGRRIATGAKTDWKYWVQVWDAATGQEILKVESGRVLTLAYSPDGRRIVTGTKVGGLKVLDAATGQEIQTLKGHLRPVLSVVYSPDGRWIVSGSDDGTAKVWDAATGKKVLTLKGHTGGVFSVAFSPDGRRIVTGSWDLTVKVWDLPKSLEVRPRPPE